ncbi:MAG: hypothetical protein GY727_02625 [Gammaproteobacteria bacterium]|nr:hypothetical protein [Gammaproteobacteria bacterium]MCP4088778.1 hypothetical protein [Gammaproteobacteria bacterium]MCP4275923.1 hypothetical protein [Gammaproteobacteria bacterium]MCP4832139.1 hypothetical protein [Gammaproteobacteria bacterium]MCP4928260.1 hypothetical protein [Gammaproteobacteria bacterium]
MLQKSMFVFILSSLLLTGITVANTLIIDGVQPTDGSQYPLKGSAKASVLALLGEPLSKTQAVGEPPISSWEYTSFVVYFEYDHVLHTVAKRSPSSPLPHP